ncbi:Pcl5p NDAI_0C01980 [Naumovozyma dairenensis CBS 421]|uniref:Uncharacterized protein n=1 Tax=Naumovozyma dairenensis (strain ATCC 10597 / BCRC 20456 / CBS 421 / NBRC 0211 / NRRL Y-12639) TaxID=1071378 RepID=G0W7U7_NAUDC|nr:hypothetical protein NDAI_0C01980 [Naumovozyma dairenensis CBS 421]CCD23858.1 hypothetical protein NDAI_0C01980 [Naumovozyma dairenensis CBS 421]
MLFFSTSQDNKRANYFAVMRKYLQKKENRDDTKALLDLSQNIKLKPITILSNSKLEYNMSLVDTIAEFLSETVKYLSTKKVPNEKSSIKTYLMEILKRSQSSRNNVIVASFYFQKLYNSVQLNQDPNPEFVHCSKRIFLSCLILSHKFLNDKTFSMKAWSLISGISKRDLSILERWCLMRLNYHLVVDVTEINKWSFTNLKKWDNKKMVSNYSILYNSSKVNKNIC